MGSDTNGLMIGRCFLEGLDADPEVTLPLLSGLLDLSLPKTPRAPVLPVIEEDIPSPFNVDTVDTRREAKEE